MSRFALGILVLSAISSAARAIPPTATASDTIDDATITLAVSTARIVGDDITRCTVRIEVGSTDVAFTDGDTVELSVFEDDTVDNDILFTTAFAVDASEVSAGRVDRTFLCGDAFPDSDAGGDLEVFAEAVVTKDACGTFCIDDRPSTANISVALVTDDMLEEDDTVGTGPALGPGTTVDRIAADSDWSRISLTAPASLDIAVLHEPSGGRLDAELSDSSPGVVATAVDDGEGSSLTTDILAPGDYDLHVRVRAPDDYNFYDLEIAVTTADCVPGAVDTEACGMCGSRTRSCDSSGSWTAFGACGDEGVCAPGETRDVACGMCGTRTETCDGECAWVAGSCLGGGECVPDSVDTRSCPDDSMQMRTCAADCTWGDFTTCEPSTDGGIGDGGAADGGAAVGADGGSDSGVRVDASAPTPDGGGSAALDGGSAGADPSSGCACRAGSPRVPLGTGALLFLAAVVRVAGRRRRRSR